MSIRMSLAVVVGLLATAPSCSANFTPKPCKTDADCGSGLTCTTETSSCVAAAALPPLRIGMSAPVSGTNNELGIEMKRGLTAALNEINAKGGIRSRTVELAFLDDGYQAALAETAVRKLLDVQPMPGVPPRCPTTTMPPVADQMPFSDTALARGPNAVLAMVGNVGTPTMVRSAPIAVETQSIFFGPFTGSTTMLRDTKAGPCAKYIFNVRASYAEEARASLEFFLARGVKDWQHLISFDQSDSFGQQGFDGLTHAYADVSAQNAALPPADPMTPIARFRYSKDDPTGSVPGQVQAVTQYISAVLAADKAPHTFGVLMTDTYGSALQFITALRQWQYGAADRASRLTIHLSNVSFVGPNSLATRLQQMGSLTAPDGSLKPYTEGVFVSQVLPNYQSDQSDISTQYKAAMAAAGLAPTFTSFEGYVTGRIFLEGLKAHRGEITSDGLVSTFETLPNLSLGFGATAGFSPQVDPPQAIAHQYLKSIWGTSIAPDGSFANLYYWTEGVPISFFQ